MKYFLTIILCVCLLSCEKSKTTSSEVSLKDSTVRSKDSSDALKSIDIKKDTIDKKQRVDENIKSGYFLLVDEISRGDTLIKGMYLKFDFKEGFFFMFDEENQRRIELPIEDFDINSNMVSIEGHNSQTKILFDGQIMFSDDVWNDVVQGQTIVLKGDLRFNNISYKNLDFVWTVGE